MKKRLHGTASRACASTAGGRGAPLAARRSMHSDIPRARAAQTGEHGVLAVMLPVLALAAILGLSACRSAEPSDGGIRIGDKTLAQFQPNETSEHWLVSIIGPPTTRTEVTGLAEPTSILRYSVIEKGSGGLLSLFTGGSPPKTTATIYFIVRGGVVTQFWADREEQATLFGGKTEKDKGEKED
jgi:hypothetical protein